MGNLRVAKMLLKNSGKTNGKHKGQDLIDVREAVKVHRFLFGKAGEGEQGHILET